MKVVRSTLCPNPRVNAQVRPGQGGGDRVLALFLFPLATVFSAIQTFLSSTMPLLFSAPVTPASILASLPLTDEPHYLIFFASIEERGRPWCRDCEAAEGPLAASIPDRDSSIVYVGDRVTWNDPANPFKQAPFNVERIPTVLKLSGDSKDIKEKVATATRIVEADILEGSKLRAFLKS